MLWQHIMLCCGAVARCASYDPHLATAPQHIPTQHDMLPQHLVCKYELNCEYCNITLAGNKAPWWWSDKIETCRSVLKCFKIFYVILYVHSLVDKLKWFYEIARCYNKIYTVCRLPVHWIGVSVPPPHKKKIIPQWQDCLSLWPFYAVM